jgi:hypothetical protein
MAGHAGEFFVFSVFNVQQHNCLYVREKTFSQSIGIIAKTIFATPSRCQTALKSPRSNL